MVERVPSYLSARSADIILSEIRPTEIKQEALVSLNVLLDELLWLTLNSARSFNTEKIKSDGLLKVLPTALGKDAVLEAEVELRAYWDRTDPKGRGTNIPEHTPSKPAAFPLQQAFELMRQKCEVYSTLGDVDEDFDEEMRLQNQLSACGPAAPRSSAVAPAALYITAILEHVCEHILSNVARVVARDSSRATALVNDLYVALCEDDGMYHLFMKMKVKDQIEAQSKPIRPRRSKSITSAIRTGSTSPAPIRSSTSSPQPPRISESSGGHSKPRVSIELQNSGGPRQSMEKKGLKLFGGGGGSSGAQTELAQNGQATKGHNRSESANDSSRRPAVLFQNGDEDDDLAASAKLARHDFDELMRSGTTMKVSLTPDRLKTFEVFSKEKNQRNRANSAASNMTIPPSTDPIPPLPTTGLTRKNSRSNFTPRPAKVEAIEEDQEESSSSNPDDVHKPRVRTQSLAQFLQEAPPWEPKDAPRSADQSTPVPAEPPVVSRKRSGSMTKASPVSSIPTILPSTGFLSRQQSASRLGNSSPSSPPSSFSPRLREELLPNGADAKTAKKRGQQGGRDSFDLEDLMSDDLDDASSGSKPSGRLRKSKKAAGPGISSGTRDLINFLSEGPADAAASRSISAGSVGSKTKTQGRFGRMMSRLSRSSSSEHINSKKLASSVEDLSRAGTPGSLYGGLANRPVVPPITRPAPSPTLANDELANGDTPANRPRKESLFRRKTGRMNNVSASVTGPIEIPGGVASALSSKNKSKSRPGTASSLPEKDRSAQDAASIDPAVLAVPSLPRSSRTPSPSRDASYPAVALATPLPTKVEQRGNKGAVATEHKSSLQIDLASEGGCVMPEADGSQDSTDDDALKMKASKSYSTTRTQVPQQSVTSSQISTSSPTPPTVSIPQPLPAVDGVVIPVEQAQRLRTVLEKATSAGECRVLVEMFLAQWGLPREHVPEEVTLDRLHEETKKQERRVVASLLEDGDSSSVPSGPTTLIMTSLTSPTAEGTNSVTQSEDTHTEEDCHGPHTPIDDVLPTGHNTQQIETSFIPDTQSGSPTVTDTYSPTDSPDIYVEKSAPTAPVSTLAI